MKRVIISLLLLTLVFLMSGFFIPEANYLTTQTPTYSYSCWQNEATNQQPLTNNFLNSDDYANNLSGGSPTMILVLLAGLACSLAMAIFIYGSHFVAILIARL